MKLSVLVEISAYAYLSNITDMIQLKSSLMDGQCLHLLSCCCDKNPGQKHSQERGVHFAHLSRSQSVVEGSQGRGSGRAAIGRPKLTGDDCGILLTDMLAMACSVCLFIPPRPLAQQRHHLQCAVSSHGRHSWRKCPTDLPIGNLVEAILQIRFLLPDASGLY